MTQQTLIRIHPADSVAVALRPVARGEHLEGDSYRVTAAEDIPAGHKIALTDIAPGQPVIKYGYPIGRAKCAIAAGSRVHTHNLETLLSQTAQYTYGSAPAALRTAKPAPVDVYCRADGQIGIRNEIWILPTVGCVNKTAEILARLGDAELSGHGTDGVYAFTHPYGCSQMGDDHETTRRVLAALAHHPNAGAVLVVGLGCENNTPESFKTLLSDIDPARIAFLVTQNCPDEIAEGRKLLAGLAAYTDRQKREPSDMSRLVIGMKCGGSDGFSGITANALAGYVCDKMSESGGTVLLTEVPEMFGAEQMLMDRCVSRDVFTKTVSLITDFKDYYVKHGQTVYENPSPGNKEGGITTLEDKSCGCVQKGGSAPVTDVLRYGQRLSEQRAGQTENPAGIVLLEGPGNDIVSATALTAAGAHIILFTTGRGTPLGAPVPTLKIASNSDLAHRKPAWIDFDAGRMLSENIDTVHDDILSLIRETVSGKKTKNEQNGYREIAVFKNGVTL